MAEKVEKLNLERVRCRTLVENRRVISFHESCGLVREESFATVGESLPTVMHTLSRAEWPAIRARLDRLATLTYRGAGEHDQRALLGHLRHFVKRLRVATGERQRGRIVRTRGRRAHAA